MGNNFISEQHIDYSGEKQVKMGMMSSHRWHMDPKVLMISLARYKFIAKMLGGKTNVLEVGCGDGFGTHIVAKEVTNLLGIDIDPKLVADAKASVLDNNVKFMEHDICASALFCQNDAVYLLDVLEHIFPEDEDVFMKNISSSLVGDGVCIVGIPSLESQAYASVPSKATHVNCKSGNDFKEFMEKYFNNVFLFSMNDEVVHTGYNKMAHYLLCLCVGKKED